MIGAGLVPWFAGNKKKKKNNQSIISHSCLISLYWKEEDPDLCLTSIHSRLAAAFAGKEYRHAADGQVYHN